MARTGFLLVTTAAVCAIAADGVCCCAVAVRLVFVDACTNASGFALTGAGMLRGSRTCAAAADWFGRKGFDVRFADLPAVAGCPFGSRHAVFGAEDSTAADSVGVVDPAGCHPELDGEAA